MQALWMVLAAFLFASMGVCVKIASEHFNSAELVCYRGLIGMLILWLLARSQKVRLATQYPGMHAWRLVCDRGRVRNRRNGVVLVKLHPSPFDARLDQTVLKHVDEIPFVLAAGAEVGERRGLQGVDLEFLGLGVLADDHAFL